ncbi:MAG: peroxiredoxin [Anaeromyxobacter sp.]
MLAPLLALALTAPLKVGDKAPDFTLPDTDGKPVQLSALLQRGPVMLAFYPKAFTSGCTKQNEAFRDRFAEVEKKGAQVVGISTDDVETQRRFRAELKLPYPLLADPEAKVVNAYVGTIPVVGRANRANVIIGQDGKVTGLVEGSDAIDPSSAISMCPLRKAGGSP